MRPPTPCSVASRILAWGLVGWALPVLACAAPCQRVAHDHEAFSARSATAQTPHLSLSVPFAIVDQLVAKQVASLPAQRLKVPAIAGVSVGTLAVRVERVQARRAAPGRLGFLIQVGLSSGRTRVLGIDIEAAVSPRIDPQTHEIVVALEGRNIERIEAKLGGGGARQLADFVWAQLPAPAQMLTSKRQIEQLVSGVSEELMHDAFELVRRELLDDLGEITRIELELPDMPVSSVQLSTEPGFVTLDVMTTLPVARGLAPRAGRVEGVHPNVVQVRIAGPTAAELANHAMRTGDIPARWTLAGEPDEDGPLRAGLAWNEGAGKPLFVHLWRLEKDCAHVVLGATPLLSLDGDALRLRTDDAKIEKVEGPLKVRAGIWFSGLGRRSFEFVEDTAASFSFEIAGETLGARVHSVALASDELVVGLKLDHKPSPRRTR